MQTEQIAPVFDQARFDNSFTKLPNQFFTRVKPKPLAAPKLVSFNEALAEQLGLRLSEQDREIFVQAMSGHSVLPGTDPIAMKYTGHQFGVYNPDLGDGRGLLLGEWIAPDQKRWDWHLKGAGTTPYSRGGDGRAVLRSSIREYLGSEAIHHLGIPTTRALCIVGSQEPVYRESIETGATLLRVASTHVRFGHFEYCYYRNDEDGLRVLADYVIQRHFPEWRGEVDRYRRLLEEVILRTARMIAAWQAVGFNHGVMNTDNMSILGETFDYGPFAFLDDYQSNYICNHSDYQGRYAFGQQPRIGLWNCQCLAQAMLPLVGETVALAALKQYEEAFHGSLITQFRSKLGLSQPLEGDAVLVRDLLNLLDANRTDYTIFFRALSRFQSIEQHGDVRDLFLDREAFDAWAQRYHERLLAEQEDYASRRDRMNRHNPKYILRNYMAQNAIEAAQRGDFSEVDQLLELLQKPFDEQPQFERYAGLPPDWGKGMEISCSS